MDRIFDWYLMIEPSCKLKLCIYFYLNKKGGSVAFLFRVPFHQVKTIALETGIQNTGLAFLIIFTNFPSPESDLAGKSRC